MAAKGAHWSDAEVRCLLEIWADANIQNLLDKTHKNSEIFAEIRDYLTDRGYHRTVEQCRDKIKKLRMRYIRVREALRKSGGSSNEKLKFHYYDAVDAILGSKLSSDPSIFEPASQQNNGAETPLSGENIKCELEDKEAVLQLLQDIQSVTLPEPSSSSQTESGDHSQSQSPLPLISDVSTWTSYKSNADANSYSGHIARSSISSPIPGSSAQVTKAIANFLIMDLHPPTLVGGKGFIKLIHCLFPSYKELPSPFLLEDLLKEHHRKVKKGLADMMRTSSNGETEKICDYTGPIENECRRHGRPPRQQGEVPYCVTLSAEVWVHIWEGNNEGYVTLWAHYIDTNFNCHNVCLATQRLIERVMPDNSLQSLEIQVKIMAQEWGIAHLNLVLLGGQGRTQMRLQPRNKEKCAGSDCHPNSTIFIEKEKAVPSNESQNLECSPLSEGLLFVPCFFSVVQSCIEAVMSHPVVSKTLSQFQGVLLTLLQPPGHSSPLLYSQSVLQTLSKQEQMELNSWACHCQPNWYRLYPLLSTLLKHKSLIMDFVKESKCENVPDEEIASASSSFNSCTNSSTRSAKSNMVPSLCDWSIVEELSSVLKPLDVACQTLAKEAFPRLSLMKPILTGLLSRHLVCRPGDSIIPKEMKQMVRERLASHYSNPEVNRVLCVACALDPQFHGLGFMEKTEQNKTFEWLKKDAIRIAKEDDGKTGKIKNLSSSKRSLSSDSRESESYFLRSKRLKQSCLINLRDIEDEEEDEDEMELAEPDSQGEVSGIEFLLGDLFSTTRRRQDTVEESVDMEVSVFRAGAGASLGIEPLQWWRTKAVQFPLLAKVALAYLAAPAVVGDMARNFVQDRRRATKRNRHNISPASLDTILFLHYNHMLTSNFSCG